MDQQLAGLTARRTWLLDQLQRQRTTPAEPPGRAAAALAVPGARRWSAQRLLLGLGVLLVVVAGLVFVAVSWRVLGVVGQVGAVAVGVVAAGVAGRLLERRRLSASAEAAAALSAGLLVVGLTAAHTLGLGGLDAVDPVAYAAGAALVAALVCTAASLSSSVRTWPVVAVLAAAAAPLLGLYAADADPLPATVAFAVTAAAFWSLRFVPPVLAGLRPPARMVAHGYLAGTWILPLGWVGADDPQGLACTGVALATAVAVLGWQGRAGAGSLWFRHPVLVGTSVAAAAFQLAAGSSTLPAWTHAGVVVVAASGAAVRCSSARALRTSWTGVAAVVAAGTAAVGSVLLVPRLAVRADPDGVGRIVAAGAWLPTVLALAAGAAAAGLVAVRRADRRTGASGCAAAAGVATLGVAAGTQEPAVLAAALAASGVVIAGWALWSVAAEKTLAVVALAAWVVAVSAALQDERALTVSLVLSGASVVALAYGFRPGRRALWWVGAGLGAAGRWVLLADDQVRAVEAYSLPLAGLCLLAGVLGWWRYRDSSSWAVAGPGLAAGLLPSAAVSVGDESLLRPLLVLGASTAVLLLGVRWRRQALVLVPAVAVVVVVVSQLGPYAVGLPRWLSLGSVGVLLLAVGIRYEARRRNARSAVRWLRSLG